MKNHAKFDILFRSCFMQNYCERPAAGMIRWLKRGDCRMDFGVPSLSKGQQTNKCF